MTAEPQYQSFPTVWHGLFDDPVERQNLMMRSNLIMAIEDRVKEWGVTQKEAAKRLGITQPRLNMLLKGRINEFSLDALVALLEPAGLQIEFNVRAA